MQKNLIGVLTGLFFLFLSILCAPFAKGQYQTHYGGQSLVYTAPNSNSIFADIVATGDGTLFVLDIGLKEIYSLTPANGGGYTQNVIANSSSGIDLYGYSIDVDASGNVYLSDSATVTAFAPNGSGGYNQHTLVPTGNLGGTTAGVTVDNKGNVYVIAWAGAGPTVYTLYELTPTGGWNYTTKTILTSAGGLLTVNGQTTPFAPNGPLRVDKNGVLYFVNGDGELFSETPSSGGWTLEVVLNANTAAGTINVQSAPLEVAVDSAANVYALTSLPKGNAVEALNINGTYYMRTIGSGTEADGTALTVDANGNLYEVSGFFNEIYEFTTSQQSFANTNLGATSAVLSFPFTIGSETAQVSSGKALSMDASGEFTDTGTGTCDTNGPTHHYIAGDTCTVNVAFTPQYAGLRKGVVQVVTSAGVMVAEQYVTGFGVGPQLAFLPPVVSTVGTFSSPTGVAADDKGDVYVLDTGAAKIYLETPSGSSYTQSTLTSVYGKVPSSAGLAIDAGGNLYFNDITDETTWFYQMTGTTVSESVQAADTSEKVTLNSPNGLAVDAAGDLFIADTGNDRVIESVYYGGDQYGGTAASPWAWLYPEIVPVATGLNSPKAVATDAAGHVLIADTGNNRILIETPTSNYGFTQSVLSTSSLNAPGGVAVDNFNNIYIADTGNKRILEEAVGSGGTYTESVLLSTGVNSPGQLTLDGAGNLYVVDNGSNSVLKVGLGTAPTLNFDATAAGQTSADSPLNVTLSNVGNAALNFSVPSSGNNPSISTNFELGSGGSADCPVVSSSAADPGVLDAQSNCILPVSFIPTTTGTITGTLILTDNASTSPQVINLNGSGTGAVSATLTSPVSFPNTGVGTTSSAFFATLTNTGSSTLTLSSIALSGSGVGDFNLTTGSNACSPTGTVAAGGSCNIYVTLTPAAAQNYSATLTVTDNASPAMQTSALSGTGVAPSATLTSTVSFPNTNVGSTSSALFATLSNSGTSSLTLNSIALSGAGVGGFTLTTGSNACSPTGTVAAGGSCNIYVTFTPAAAQNYSATLTVTDNAQSSTTQTSTLTGTGTLAPDFSITASPAAQSVAPGTNASYTVSLTALNGSFGNAVSLSVTGLPTGAEATFTPSSLIPGTEGASNSTLTIQTVKPLSAQSENHPRWPLAVLALLLFVPINKRWRKSWQSRAMMLVGALALTLSAAGCSAGFAIQPAAQSYKLTITGSAPSPVAVSATITHTTTVQLTVQ
jgi:sugar lactone lactonase YvrE